MTTNQATGQQFDSDQRGGVAVIAFATVLVLAAPVLVIAISVGPSEPPAGLDSALLTGMLAAAALVGFAAAGSMSILRYRLVGDRVSIPVGLVLALLGILLVGVGIVLPLLLAHASAQVAVRALVAGAAYTATALAVMTLVVAYRRSGQGLSRAVLLALVILAAATSLAVALLSSAESTTVAASYVIPAQGTLLTPVQIGIWFSLAVLLLRPSLRRSREVLPWFGLALLAMAFAEVLARNVAEVGDSWSSGRVGVVVLAAVMALYGVALDLGAAFRSQERTLTDERQQRQQVQRQHDLHVAAEEEALHDASSSILAIQGAARVLEASEDGMIPGQRRAMMSALSGEVDRLRQIIDRSPRSDPVEPFDVAAAVAPVVGVRSHDRDIEFDPSVAVVASGRARDLAEVVQTLLDNAIRHGGGTVGVTIRQSDGTVHVSVHDQGPGIPEARRAKIFERGVTTHDAGSGLGLFIARQLMLEQGGDLWVESGPHGGASFIAALPATEKVGVSLSAVADLPMQEMSP